MNPPSIVVDAVSAREGASDPAEGDRCEFERELEELSLPRLTGRPLAMADPDIDCLYDLLQEGDATSNSRANSHSLSTSTETSRKSERILHILWVDETKRKDQRKANAELESAARDCLAGFCAFTVSGLFSDEGYTLALSRNWDLVVVHVQDEAAASFPGRYSCPLSNLMHFFTQNMFMSLGVPRGKLC